MAKKNQKFETSVQRLEEIVSLMEEDVNDLDRYIKLYEEGKKLIGQCRKTLAGYEEKIVQLSEEDDEIVEAELDL